MSNALFGLETEYAFTPFDHNGQALNRTDYSKRFVALAARLYPSLQGRDKYDLFLSNGARLYVDSGMGLINLEYSTPECTTPGELVAHTRAGDRLFAKIARELEHKWPEVRNAFISKTNFDYSGHTSGSHENYLHRAPQAILAPNLIPHLVSRIIYTGGGGFDDSKKKNIAFKVSPRVSFLKKVTSGGAQENRAIFTTRNEPLSVSRYGRLHLLCNEGLRFDMSEYLRFGVTALLIRLADSGVNLANSIEIKPLSAIRIVAQDTECKKEIGNISGVPATAIDLQRHYLAQVRSHIGKSYLPVWAAHVCNCWAMILDELNADPMQLAGVLDWPTKLALYQNFVTQKGSDWKQLTRGTDKNQREMRAKLFEFDVRFGDISKDSPFDNLAKEIGPSNILVTDGEIDDALSTPPQNTRAKLRGEWVSRLNQSYRGKQCDWNSILDKRAKQSLNFDNPFGTTCPGWTSM